MEVNDYTSSDLFSERLKHLKRGDIEKAKTYDLAIKARILNDRMDKYSSECWSDESKFEPKRTHIVGVFMRYWNKTITAKELRHFVMDLLNVKPQEFDKYLKGSFSKKDGGCCYIMKELILEFLKNELMTESQAKKSSVLLSKGANQQ